MQPRSWTLWFSGKKIKLREDSNWGPSNAPRLLPYLVSIKDCGNLILVSLLLFRFVVFWCSLSSWSSFCKTSFTRNEIGTRQIEFSTRFRKSRCLESSFPFTLSTSPPSRVRILSISYLLMIIVIWFPIGLIKDFTFCTLRFHGLVLALSIITTY